MPKCDLDFHNPLLNLWMLESRESKQEQALLMTGIIDFDEASTGGETYLATGIMFPKKHIFNFFFMWLTRVLE